MFKVVKMDRETGIVLIEKFFSDVEKAYDFAHQVGKLGYKKAENVYALYESSRYYITVIPSNYNISNILDVEA